MISDEIYVLVADERGDTAQCEVNDEVLVQNRWRGVVNWIRKPFNESVFYVKVYLVSWSNLV